MLQNRRATPPAPQHPNHHTSKPWPRTTSSPRRRPRGAPRARSRARARKAQWTRGRRPQGPRRRARVSALAPDRPAPRHGPQPRGVSSTGAAAARRLKPIKEKKKAGPAAARAQAHGLRQGQDGRGPRLLVLEEARGSPPLVTQCRFVLQRDVVAAMTSTRLPFVRGPRRRRRGRRESRASRASHGTTLSFDAVEMDGKANKEGAFERKWARRPQFAPGRPLRRLRRPTRWPKPYRRTRRPSARKAREVRAQHGRRQGPRPRPLPEGESRSHDNAASPGVAALHNGRTGVVRREPRAGSRSSSTRRATSRRNDPVPQARPRQGRRGRESRRDAPGPGPALSASRRRAGRARARGAGR